MNIGVVGYGVVGKAVSAGFLKKGHAVYINDPYMSQNCPKIGLAIKCELIFLCLPTPCKQTGEIDLSTLDAVIAEFAKYQKCPPLIIKSTVVPGTTDRYTEKYPNLTFAVNPEFLREKTALKDFLSPERTVIGCADNQTRQLLYTLYTDFDAPVISLSPTEAELVKYASNLFLVGKVAFTCQIEAACKKLGADAKRVLHAVGLDSRIGPSHLEPAGKIKADSPCLPKDTAAFISFLRENSLDSSFFTKIMENGVETTCQS